MDLSSLEQTLGLTFRNQDLLKEALTHRSYINENPSWPLSHNERLEYLGDAVLELIVTEENFTKFPKFEEGELTLLRAALVNYVFLAKVAKDIRLQDYVYLSRGEARDSSRAKEVILANAIEAVIGAMYLDAGIEAPKGFVQKYITSKSDEVLTEGSFKDPKSLLQEFMQEKEKVTPTYKVTNEMGPDHKKVFSVVALVGEKEIGRGHGPSKQEAETDAAKDALVKLNHK